MGSSVSYPFLPLYYCFSLSSSSEYPLACRCLSFLTSCLDAASKSCQTLKWVRRTYSWHLLSPVGQGLKCHAHNTSHTVACYTLRKTKKSLKSKEKLISLLIPPIQTKGMVQFCIVSKRKNR
eukprot:TRINITY_DN3859_c3_g1_i1.p1 TRINITY_DN3859_c3_g1~~TRINITY_DN3859_c3_g1_i1.p1  ORF type:complete len:122 (+),score=0.88 TRINITY_DN3859_c3_g1_i1:1199-1564(+)